MAQKLVSFEIAKVLKDAGYPQANNDLYYNENGTIRCCSPHTFTITYACPTYLSVWLWLWNTKNIQIEVADKSYFAKAKVIGKFFVETNPEEAIANAIGFLVENNLIK